MKLLVLLIAAGVLAATVFVLKENRVLDAFGTQQASEPAVATTSDSAQDLPAASPGTPPDTPASPDAVQPAESPATAPAAGAANADAARAAASAEPRILGSGETLPAAPKVDETALRYFARQGDSKRLETEIARLKVLYPEWSPPADPAAAPVIRDQQLDAMWKLYAEGKLAEVRKAIGDRQAAEPGWPPPADLLDRVSMAEARAQLINASDLKQYETVVRLGSANSSLLTCGDVDVLWRVAEAFARTDRPDRAKDAYLYILGNCDDAAERLATVQKAIPLLSRANVELLLAAGRAGADGKGEFETLRPELARQSVAAGDADAKVVASPADLATVEKLAKEGGLASDALLLGWYHLRRADPKLAEQWFATARAAENSAAASQGLALALVDQSRPAEAEAILYEWRAATPDTAAVYLAAVTNLLAVTPPAPIAQEVLQRMVAEIVAASDATAAQEVGWYADGLNQFKTASQWFATALGWKPDDEPSAYGLALMRWKLGDAAGFAEMQHAWAGRSDRIAAIGKTKPRRASEAQPPASAAPAAVQTAAENPPVTRPAAEPDISPIVTGSSRRQQPRNASRSSIGGCTATVNPETLAPDVAVARGWCLMDLNRPLEAAAAFEIGLRSNSPAALRDAAYGQSLAYLRAGLSDLAAVSAAKAPQDGARSNELQTALLAAQATGAFEAKRYVETLLALDERARIAPERIDLLVLRGYAYLNLGRLGDAERVFRAAAGTGDHEALKGLGAVQAKRDTDHHIGG